MVGGRVEVLPTTFLMMGWRVVKLASILVKGWGVVKLPTLLVVRSVDATDAVDAIDAANAAASAGMIVQHFSCSLGLHGARILGIEAVKTHPGAWAGDQEIIYVSSDLIHFF